VSRRRTARWIFGIGFTILLLDGAAAIWLGQLTGRRWTVALGVLLVLIAAALPAVFRRWMRALDAVDAARREVKAELGRLRQAAAAARGDGPSFN